jgi:hypothetical protein
VLKSVYEVHSRGALDLRTIAFLRCDCTPEGGYEELFGSHRPKLRRDKGWIWVPELLGRVSAAAMVTLLPAVEIGFGALAARAVSIMSADERLSGSGPEQMRRAHFSVSLELRLEPKFEGAAEALSYGDLVFGFCAYNGVGFPVWRRLCFNARSDGRLILISNFGPPADCDQRLAAAFAPLNEDIESFWPDLTELHQGLRYATPELAP